MTDLSITPEQCRAGRLLVGWSKVRLASFAEIGDMHVIKFENGLPVADRFSIAIRQALESAGVEFICAEGEEPGVRLQNQRAAVEVSVVLSSPDRKSAGGDQTG